MTQLSVVEYYEAVPMADQISQIWRSENPRRDRVDCPKRSEFSAYFNPLPDGSFIRGVGGTLWINLYFPVPCRFEGDVATAIVIGLLLHEWLHVVQKTDSPQEFAVSRAQQSQLSSEFPRVECIPIERLWNDYYSDPLEIQAHAIQIAAELRHRGADCFNSRDAETTLGYEQPYSRLVNSSQYAGLWRETILPAAETAFEGLIS